MTEQIINELRVYMKANGLTQAVAAEKIGITLRQLNRILNGHGGTTAKVLDKMCLLMGKTNPRIGPYLVYDESGNWHFEGGNRTFFKE
nr:MAG TPA: Helix-turn-helix XRE-family like protein [Caudoviricetes sp.]